MSEGNWYNGFSPKERNDKLKVMKGLIRRKELAPAAGPCALCGDPEVPVEYHGEDYGKPYLWMPPALLALCRHCHRDKLHKRFTRHSAWQVFVAHVQRGGYARDLKDPVIKKELDQCKSLAEKGQPFSLRALRPYDRIVGSEWFANISIDPESLNDISSRPLRTASTSRLSAGIAREAMDGAGNIIGPATAFKESLPQASALFQMSPRQWGYRGDPYLWKEIKERLVGVACPATQAGLKVIVMVQFEELTGFQVSHQEDIYIKRLSHGGMSSGMVCTEFWRESAIPLLCSRMENASFAIEITKGQYMQAICAAGVLTAKSIELLRQLYEDILWQSTALRLAETLGYAGVAPVNSLIGNLGKRIASHLHLILPERKNKRPGWWQIVACGEERAEGFTWQLRIELIDALIEIGVLQVSESSLYQRRYI